MPLRIVNDRGARHEHGFLKCADSETDIDAHGCTLTHDDTTRARGLKSRQRNVDLMAHIASDADTALGRLADAVESLAEKKSRHPLTLATAVTTAKRSLSGRTTAIGLHDQIKQETNGLHAQDDLVSSASGKPSPNGGLPGMLARLEEATTVLAGLIATAAYWGDESTDRWWTEEIARLSVRSRGSGEVRVLELPLVSALHLFYAAGIAAVAAGRYELAHKLMRTMAEDSHRDSLPLCSVLSPENIYEDSGAGKRLYAHLKPLFVEHLNVGAGKYEDSWEAFEFLRLVEATYMHPRAAEQTEKVKFHGRNLETTTAEVDAAMGTNNVDRLEDAEEAQRRAVQAFRNTLAQFANLVPTSSPYVHVQYTRNGYGHTSVYGQQLIKQADQQRQLHPFVEAGFCDGDWGSLKSTCEAVDFAIGQLGFTEAHKNRLGGRGSVPNYFRIGDLDAAQQRASI